MSLQDLIDDPPTEAELDSQLLLVLSRGPMLKFEAIRRMRYPVKVVEKTAKRCGIIKSNWRADGRKFEVWSLMREYDTSESKVFGLYYCDECADWTLLPKQTLMHLQVPCRICSKMAGFKARKSNDHPYQMAQVSRGYSAEPILDWRHATRPGEATPALARVDLGSRKIPKVRDKPRSDDEP